MKASDCGIYGFSGIRRHSGLEKARDWLDGKINLMNECMQIIQLPASVLLPGYQTNLK